MFYWLPSNLSCDRPLTERVKLNKKKSLREGNKAQINVKH